MLLPTESNHKCLSGLELALSATPYTYTRSEVHEIINMPSCKTGRHADMSRVDFINASGMH